MARAIANGWHIHIHIQTPLYTNRAALFFCPAEAEPATRADFGAGELELELLVGELLLELELLVMASTVHGRRPRCTHVLGVRAHPSSSRAGELAKREGGI